MEAPDKRFSKAVVFPANGIVVGTFAGKKVALIQTELGMNIEEYVDDAIGIFTNARYVIGVGVCFAFDRSKHLLGDVLVSNKISNLANLEFSSDGEIKNHGEIIRVVHELRRIFCITTKHESDIKVSAGRISKVYKGTFVSCPIKVNSEMMCDGIHSAVDTAIGGEMEGGQLLKFVDRGKIEGVVVIKGVANYGDGVITKE